MLEGRGLQVTDEMGTETPEEFTRDGVPTEAEATEKQRFKDQVSPRLMLKSRA